MKIKDILKKKKNKSKATAKSKSNNNDASSITPPSDDTPTEDNSNLIFVGGIASGNEIISIDTDSIDVKQTLVIEDGITVDGVALTAIQSSGESFADNDTSLMTSAAIEDRIATTSAATVTKASLDVDHLITLSGVSAAADDLGTFTGSTISDSVTVKAAIQALETKVEAVDASTTGVTVTANNTTNETTYPIFVDGATGAQGAETDTAFTYNPNSGDLSIGGELAAATLDISGNIDIDGTTNLDAVDIDGAVQADAAITVGTANTKD